MERIILIFALLASCVAQEQKSLAQWTIVEEDENTVCLKEREDSQVQCYDKVIY